MTSPCQRRAPLAALGLFLALLLAYHLNGDIFPGHDPLVSMLQAESLLREGNLSFSPPEVPGLLQWRLHVGSASEEVPISYFDDALRSMYEQGLLTSALDQRRIDSIVPTTARRLYINTFAPGAALVAAPAFALFERGPQPLSDNLVRLWFTGKWVASLCVAGSAVFVFWTALRHVPLVPAVSIAAIYGFGTAVWSISSQALWQHGPDELFLAFATYQFARVTDGMSRAAWCGLGYAAATCCRPTAAIVFVAVGLFLMWHRPQASVAYLLAGAPLALALMLYNAHYFGSPLRFGQAALEMSALRKTGLAAMWQTPLWIGLPGILLSPSRGMFVYSPILLPPLMGFFVAWRNRQYRWLRPLACAIGAIWCVEAIHFDWWSGWSFGYRHVVDTVPLLILGWIPLVPVLRRRRWLTAAYAPLLVWSVGVQVLGAWAYDAEGWNARRGYEARFANSNRLVLTFDVREADRWRNMPEARVEPVQANVDDPRFRGRLWSLCDNQIAYYLAHFQEAREFRRHINAVMPHLRTGALTETHLAIAKLQAHGGRREEAIKSVRRSLDYDRANRAAESLLRELTAEHP